MNKEEVNKMLAEGTEKVSNLILNMSREIKVANILATIAIAEATNKDMDKIQKAHVFAKKEARRDMAETEARIKHLIDSMMK